MKNADLAWPQVKLKVWWMLRETVQRVRVLPSRVVCSQCEECCGTGHNGGQSDWQSRHRDFPANMHSLPLELGTPDIGVLGAYEFSAPTGSCGPSSHWGDLRAAGTRHYARHRSSRPAVGPSSTGHQQYSTEGEADSPVERCLGVLRKQRGLGVVAGRTCQELAAPGLLAVPYWQTGVVGACWLVAYRQVAILPGAGLRAEEHRKREAEEGQPVLRWAVAVEAAARQHWAGVALPSPQAACVPSPSVR